MSEQVRQKWIGLVLDLLIAYREMLEGHEVHPDVFIRPWCDRVADAIGDGATGGHVYESLQRRLQGRH